MFVSNSPIIHKLAGLNTFSTVSIYFNFCALIEAKGLIVCFIGLINYSINLVVLFTVVLFAFNYSSINNTHSTHIPHTSQLPFISKSQLAFVFVFHSVLYFIFSSVRICVLHTQNNSKIEQFFFISFQ